MDISHLSHMSVLGLVFIVAGVGMVFFDLYRIYRYWLTLNWLVATGTVSGVSRVGGIYISISFTYSAFDGYHRQYKSSQTVPKDIWSENLLPGRLIPVRYDPRHPESVFIQQRQVWSYMFFGILNSLWILLGFFMFLIFH
jgi:hypothetical protein